jgi:hypothetical protein
MLINIQFYDTVVSLIKLSDSTIQSWLKEVQLSLNSVSSQGLFLCLHPKGFILHF